MKQKPPAAKTALVTVDDTEPDCLVVIAAGDHRWDLARKLRDQVKQAFLRGIDAQVMLGGELMTLKTKLGFDGSGRRKEKGHRAPCLASPRTWEEWCQDELGISERTAQRFIACFKLIQGRAEKLGEDSEACRLLGTPANELAAADYKVVSQVLHQLIGEQSQADLLREFNLLKRPQVMTGGDTSAARKIKFGALNSVSAAGLLELSYSGLVDALHQIRRFRNKKDLDAWLFLIPLVPDGECIGLENYRESVAVILADAIKETKDILNKLDQSIEAKRESNAATMKRARRNQALTNR